MTTDTAVSTRFRNRKVGSGWEDPASLIPNPENWRKHGRRQRELLQAMLEEVGWVDALIKNVQTGHLLDGHLRAGLAVAVGETAVPVDYVDLSPDEERKILLTFDPIGTLADGDPTILENLRQAIDWQNETLATFAEDLSRAVAESQNRVLQALADATDAQDYGDVDGDETDEDEDGGPGRKDGNVLEEVPDELDGPFQLRPGRAYLSDLKYQLPPYRDDMFYTVETPLNLWAGDDLREVVGPAPYLLNYSTSCRTIPFDQTILAFYTSDNRFEPLWNDPDKYATRWMNAGLLGVVSPNYSLFSDAPFPARLWNTYRARWLGRYFQDAGFYLIPDINWGTVDDLDFTLVGIPKGVPCVSIQLQNFDKKDQEEVDEHKYVIRTILERVEPQHFLVYASRIGRETIASMNLDVPMSLLPTLMDYRREKLNNKG